MGLVLEVEFCFAEVLPVEILVGHGAGLDQAGGFGVESGEELGLGLGWGLGLLDREAEGLLDLGGKIILEGVHLWRSLLG